MILYHGTSSQHLGGFESGQAEELYLTSSFQNAEEYAREKVEEEGGQPVVIQFDLARLTQRGTLQPDWKWIQPRPGRRASSYTWQEALKETGHVVYSGPIDPIVRVQ